MAESGNAPRPSAVIPDHDAIFDDGLQDFVLTDQAPNSSLLLLPLPEGVHTRSAPCLPASAVIVRAIPRWLRMAGAIRSR